MFGKIGEFFRDIQINRDFTASEKTSKKAHLEEAESKYSVKGFESERTLLLMRIEQGAKTNYDYLISDKKKTLVALEGLYNEKNTQFITLTRDYQNEIKTLYDKKQDLYALKSELFTKNKMLKDELRQAFEDRRRSFDVLRDCKSDLGDFRKRYHGDKLPVYSFFGPTLGDLETLKGNRDAAYQATVEADQRLLDVKSKESKLQSEISKVESEIVHVNNQIQSVKDARSQKFKLKESGVLKETLKIELAQISDAKIKARTEINSLESEKIKFIEREKIESGLNELEERIAFILQEKAKFIKEFDLEENLLNRKKAHRTQWLKKNS